MAAPSAFAAALRTYAETLAMVAASTGLGLLIAPRWGDSAVDMLYLVPVLAAASLYGLRQGIAAALASTLAYNFFFTEPLHSFAVHSPADIVTLIMLFTVALVVGQLAARMRGQARIAAAAAARNATIAGFAGQLLSSAGQEEIGRISCAELAALFGANAVMVVGAEVVASAPAAPSLTPADVAAAAWVVENGESAGRGAPRLNPADWLFFPVRAGTRTLAALGLAREDGGPPVPEAQRPLLENLLDQAALALERAALEGELRDVAALRERDRLRTALLSSVGHDLRTPLTAITAASAALRRRAGGDDDAALVETIEAESGRLERYIANLLDMARIEAGGVRLKNEPIDLVDAVSAATRDLARSLAGRDLAVAIPADLPLVRTDPQLLHHCLINLIDNAARHGGGTGAIEISARAEGDAVVLAVADAGPGLAAGDPFATFARGQGSDRSGGAGLGLAIVAGFAEAMGVGVAAANRAERGGALFTLRFPDVMAIKESVDG